MSLNDILNVAIVLVTVYVSLSCVCSWINEQIASMLRLRGQFLYNGVLNLLLGNKPLVEKIFAHPLVTSASRDADGRPRVSADAAPAEIPAAGAAAPARPDGAAVAQAGTAAAAPAPPSGAAVVPTGNVAPAADPKQSPLARTQNSLRERLGYRPSYIDARNFSVAFWQSARTFAQGGAAPVTADKAAIMADIATTIDTLPDPDLKVVLSSLLAQAGGEYDKLLALTDAWFNSQMDRVSGWYHRKTQWIIVIIAFCVVTYFGIDSLAAVKALSVDSSATQKAVDRIVAVLPAPASIPSPSPSESPDPTSSAVAAFAKKMQDGIGDANEQIWSSLIDLPCPKDCGTLSLFDAVADRWKLWSGHFFGLLLTVVALSLGGPFWFNVLQGLANVRSAGTTPSSTAASSVGGSAAQNKP